jgi:hypothetical protein
METLAASAPPESRTGMPPMIVHGHSALLTVTVLPDPPKESRPR